MANRVPVIASCSTTRCIKNSLPCVHPVVAWIQFSSTRHCVGFFRDLVKAASVGFVEDAVEHVGLFFVAQKAGSQGLRTRTTGFLAEADIKNAFHKMRIPGWLQAFLALPAVSDMQS